MALILSAYNYTIAYKPGAKHANADSLSRLPLPEATSTTTPQADIILLMDTLQSSPITARHIRQATDKDPLLARVQTLVLQRWEDGEEKEMKPFNHHRDEMSVQDGCLLWENRVIIPCKLQGDYMKDTLGIARGVVWWPALSADIERKVKDCEQCQHQKAPAQSPLTPWERPTQPWP